ncbi:hypothetical protein SARC_06150 [Sphaeroforma arctica JP610]|uniref:Rho-GAP domain-containing protein n=1 Tax=Sphaeroforma arctica JP610 TaxID=667725 RepID=A0A0L0FZX9_9EUKA|nr:hypothetical protein SARC_06150 [Sphaeroforma arctica JP610]KNC81523.1 hypothetical protein SARC_06150 [Sphaeroforma arctica JP610]|eukprot:XP_014155425.1 hypothetical protein SARC_06150 [Sphaeroforma arctica JP610]
MLKSADNQETEGVVSESSIEKIEQRQADTDTDLEEQLKSDVTFAGHLCKRTIQERHGVLYASNPKGKALFAVVRGHGLFLYKDPACFQRVRPQEAISLRRCFLDPNAQVPQEGAFGKAAALLQTRSREKGKDRDFYGHTVAFYTALDTERDFSLSFNCQKDFEHFVSICKGMGRSVKPQKQDNVKDKKKRKFATWRGQGSREFAEKKMLTFEVPLQEYLSLRPDLQVPLIVTKCIDEVVSRGLDVEGIYRMAGGKTVIQSLRESFDENERVIDITNADEWADIHCVSNLLKQYLRSLPESLGTHNLYTHFITAATTLTGDARNAVLAFLVQCHLPTVNFTLFSLLMVHLRSVVAMSYVNKMKTENLAIVFGPTLFFPHNADPLEMISETAGQCKASI